MDTQTTPNTTGTTSPNGNSKLLWTILTILVIILIALFAWNQLHGRGGYNDDGYSSTTMGTSTAMSSSDDVASLESDLRATDVSNIDAGADIVNR